MVPLLVEWVFREITYDPIRNKDNTGHTLVIVCHLHNKRSLTVKPTVATRISLFIFFSVFGVAIALFLGGCGTVEPRPEYRKQVVTIQWSAVDDVSKACGAKALACAYPNMTPCLIVTHRNPNWELIGHEVGHCFTGNYHK